MVGGTWIEHVTSSVSRKRSPTELTALDSWRAGTAQTSNPGAPALLGSGFPELTSDYVRARVSRITHSG
jgi:hypothetical protein